MDDYAGLDFAKAVLLTIDVQRDFALPGSPLGGAGTADVLLRIRELARAFRERSRPIIHVVRLYLADGSNAEPCRRRMFDGGKRLVVPGSEGAELVDVIKPSPATRLDPASLLAGKFQSIGHNEWVMYKPRWGAFFRTPLESQLGKMGVNTVVVAGCNFPNCPRATIYEASERDLCVVLAQDAVSMASDRGLMELKGIGVYLMGTAEVIRQLAS